MLGGVGQRLGYDVVGGHPDRLHEAGTEPALRLLDQALATSEYVGDVIARPRILNTMGAMVNDPDIPGYSRIGGNASAKLAESRDTSFGNAKLTSYQLNGGALSNRDLTKVVESAG